MSQPRLFLFTIFFIFLGCVEIQSQPVRIHASNDSLHAGALFDVYIVFDSPGNFDRIILPDSASFKDPFEFRNRVRGLTRAGSDSVRIRLQFFGTTDTLITGLSAFGIIQNDTTRFEIADYPIFFRSLLTEDADMKPFKPIFQFERTSWLWILLIVLIIIAILIWYFFLKRKPIPIEEKPVLEPVKQEPFVHPLNELENGINQLEKALENDAISPDLFYVNAGDLIRMYIERTHQQPALEQTTREVVRDFRSHTSNNRLINLMREILQECDMVKFAKFSPDYDLMAEMIVKLRHYASVVSREDDIIYRNLQASYNRKYIDYELNNEKS
jgi:hypothetical protein